MLTNLYTCKSRICNEKLKGSSMKHQIERNICKNKDALTVIVRKSMYMYKYEMHISISH